MKSTRNIILLLFSASLLTGCSGMNSEQTARIASNYLDYSNSDDQKTGGIKMIPITTAKGEFNVWTKRVGNNPTMKVLLLHGGPGFLRILMDTCQMKK